MILYEGVREYPEAQSVVLPSDPSLPQNSLTKQIHREKMESSGQWLEKALGDLCQKMESGLALDSDTISGLVSYCELAHPRDAKEYLDVI